MREDSFALNPDSRQIGSIPALIERRRTARAGLHLAEFRINSHTRDCATCQADGRVRLEVGALKE